MRILVFSLVVASLMISCSPTKKISTDTKDQNMVSEIGRNGSSYEKAIIIKEKSETAGVHTEYAWLSENYPGYQVKLQSLTYKNKKPFDIIEIVTANGEEKSVYFDISNFYGKY